MTLHLLVQLIENSSKKFSVLYQKKKALRTFFFVPYKSSVKMNRKISSAKIESILHLYVCMFVCSPAGDVTIARWCCMLKHNNSMKSLTCISLVLLFLYSVRCLLKQARSVASYDIQILSIPLSKKRV